MAVFCSNDSPYVCSFYSEYSIDCCLKREAQNILRFSAGLILHERTDIMVWDRFTGQIDSKIHYFAGILVKLSPLTDNQPQIGRASCRERVCKYVKIWVVA